MGCDADGHPPPPPLDCAHGTHHPYDPLNPHDTAAATTTNARHDNDDADDDPHDDHASDDRAIPTIP